MFNDLIEARLGRRKGDRFWINKFHTPTLREKVRNDPLVSLVLGKKQPLVCPVNSDLESRRDNLRKWVVEEGRELNFKKEDGVKSYNYYPEIIPEHLVEAVDIAVEGYDWGTVTHYLTFLDQVIEGGLPSDIVVEIYNLFCEGIQINGFDKSQVIMQDLERKSNTHELITLKLEIDRAFVIVRDRYAGEIQGAAQYCQLSE